MELTPEHEKRVCVLYTDYKKRETSPLEIFAKIQMKGNVHNSLIETVSDILHVYEIYAEICTHFKYGNLKVVQKKKRKGAFKCKIVREFNMLNMYAKMAFSVYFMPFNVCIRAHTEHIKFSHGSLPFFCVSSLTCLGTLFPLFSRGHIKVDTCLNV